MSIDRTEPPTADPSNGYEAEAVAGIFIQGRTPIGVAQVRRWARNLPPEATVLDIGCGSGVPITQMLIDEGFAVYAVDAAPRMVNAFQRRFPCVPCACESVETSSFFDLTFDGVVAWGLMFLLPNQTQKALIRRIAGALNPGGLLLFTAPREVGTWPDNLTGLPSYSLGEAAYHAALSDAGLRYVGEDLDEGENHYYFAEKP